MLRATPRPRHGSHSFNLSSHNSNRACKKQCAKPSIQIIKTACYKSIVLLRPYSAISEAKRSCTTYVTSYTTADATFANKQRPAGARTRGHLVRRVALRMWRRRPARSPNVLSSSARLQLCKHLRALFACACSACRACVWASTCPHTHTSTHSVQALVSSRCPN